MDASTSCLASPLLSRATHYQRRHYPGILGGGRAGRSPADRETGEVDSDKVGGDHQAVAGAGNQIVDKFIRARLIDRAAFLNFGWAFLCILCLCARPRRESARGREQ